MVNNSDTTLDYVLKNNNFYEINNHNNRKKIYTDLSFNQLKDLISIPSDKKLIIYFTADWCKPCNNIKEYLNPLFLSFQDNVYIFRLNVDFESDIFLKLKSKKMVKTIPAFLVYDLSKERDDWYLADMNFSSSDKNIIFDNFQKIYNN